MNGLSQIKSNNSGDFKYCIFSIDNQKLNVAFFTMINAISSAVLAEGCYKGKVEVSFIMLREEFIKHIRYTPWVQNQESILEFTECNKRYAQLRYLKEDRTEYLGSLKQVSKNVALENENYTYRPDMGLYWITVKENPDRHWVSVWAFDNPEYGREYTDEAMVRKICMHGLYNANDISIGNTLTVGSLNIITTFASLTTKELVREYNKLGALKIVERNELK